MKTIFLMTIITYLIHILIISTKSLHMLQQNRYNRGYRYIKWILKNAKEIFYEAKGIIENMAEYCHMENLSFKQNERPSWADVNAYLDIMRGDEKVGNVYEFLSLSNSKSYEYNLDTPYKYSNGGWDFNVNDRTELDIPQDAIIEEYHGYNGITIYTRGTKGVWYLFNAVENFKMAEEKRLWEEIKKKYWS